MKTTDFSSRRFLWSFLLPLALATGCSASPATDAGTDVPVVLDSAVTDTGADSSTPPPPDGGSPDSATPPPDASAPDSSVPTQPRAVPASAMGHDRFLGVTYDAMGSFYAVGIVADGTDAMTDFRTLVAKFNADGALDTSFGTGGFASHNIATGTSGEVARGIVVQSTGKVVVAATVEHAGATDARDRDIALLRFNTNGTRDMGFGTNGVVTLDLSAGELAGSTYLADSAWGLSVYSDDRLLVVGSQKRTGGTDTDFAVLRLSADGMRDMNFGTAGLTTVDINNRSANPRTATILADGSAVVSGYMDDGGVVKPVLFKLTPAGQLDRSFGMNGIFAPTVLAAVTEAYAVALQGTSFVTAGYGRSNAMESIDWLSLRITAGGMLDTSYGMNGVARIDHAMFNDNARSLAVLPDNRVLLVGGGRPAESNSDGMIALLTANGQPDTSFGTGGRRTFDFGGAADFFWGAAVSPDRSRVAIVGAKSVGTGAGNDDGVVFVLPLR